MIRRDFTRIQGKSYTGPRLRNPFFSQSTSRVVQIAVLLLVLGGGVAIATLLTYAPFMQYRKVTVSGMTTLSADEVRSASDDFMRGRVALLIPGTHVLFARERALSEYLKERFALADVQLQRKGGVLAIQVKERISEIAWRAGDKTHLLDLQGVVVREASVEAIAAIDARLAKAAEIPFAPGTQPTMPILIDTSGADVTVGATLLGAETMQDVLALDEMLRARALLPVGYRFASPTASWLTVETVDGVSLLFDLERSSVESAIGYLDVYLEEHPDARGALEYIDLRFENHLYTKPRSV